MSKGWLERWFGDRRNIIILNMVQQHLDLTKNAVEELYNLVNASFDGNANKKKLYDKISILEKRADQIRRDMVNTLSERDAFPTEREDLMELVRAVDWIADWSREAGRILMILSVEKLPTELKTSITNMCKTNVNCVTALLSSIQMLTEDSIKAIDLSNNVEMLEEEIDELYGICRSQLIDLDYPEYRVGELILLNEFLDSVEMIADWCENTADIVRAVAVDLH
jgi:predicted phosphate transport protein (TIGR00153 family)